MRLSTAYITKKTSLLLIDPVSLEFGCTCSREKCETAIAQIGETEALDIIEEQNGTFEMDCGFCGEVYKFDKDDVTAIFAE